MANPFKTKCFYAVTVLFIITCILLWHANSEYRKSERLIGEIEYYDSLNRYNKIYYEKAFSELRYENKLLYDSLKQYKDKISYLIQFTHEKEYDTGHVSGKPNVKDSVVHDTVPMVIPQVARTYEYVSEPNDTFQYKLDVNSYTEPLWYSMKAKVKNKFTIVNKTEGDANQITIGPGNGGTITDVTVFKNEEKKNLWQRVSFGPGFTFGYDPINKQWGAVIGFTGAINLK